MKSMVSRILTLGSTVALAATLIFGVAPKFQATPVKDGVKAKKFSPTIKAVEKDQIILADRGGGRCPPCSRCGGGDND